MMKVLLIASLSIFRRSASGFVPISPRTLVIPKSGSRLFLFEDDDMSAFNALCQYGPTPFFIRITQKERYWEAVDNFQKKDGCSRVLAVRNMDAYFSDPSGWLVARDREKKYGEVTDYTKKTGVQKRPVFSLFWASFLFYFFFFISTGPYGRARRSDTICTSRW